MAKLSKRRRKAKANPPHLAMEIILDRPLCNLVATSRMKVVALWPLSDKWLGYDVVVTGWMEGTVFTWIPSARQAP